MLEFIALLFKIIVKSPTEFIDSFLTHRLGYNTNPFLYTPSICSHAFQGRFEVLVRNVVADVELYAHFKLRR